MMALWRGARAAAGFGRDAAVDPGAEEPLVEAGAGAVTDARAFAGEPEGVAVALDAVVVVVVGPCAHAVRARSVASAAASDLTGGRTSEYGESERGGASRRSVRCSLPRRSSPSGAAPTPR
jgi:hypothetical protein